MAYVNCPECKSPVDLNSEIRYSPNKGVDIFHAPCFIARQKRQIDQFVSAVVFREGDRFYYHANKAEVGDDVARMIERLGTR